MGCGADEIRKRLVFAVTLCYNEIPRETMKKIIGITIQFFAFLLMAAALAVPLAVLAFRWAEFGGDATPGPINLVAAGLAAVLIVGAGTILPIKKLRWLWSALFGLGLYCGLGFVSVFWLAKDTVSILVPFGAEFSNLYLSYIGAGVMVLGIALAAQGRALVRSGSKPARKPETVPDIHAAPNVLVPTAATSPMQTAPIISPQPIVVQVPYMMPEGYGMRQIQQPAQQAIPVGAEQLPEQSAAETPKYGKDRWGNLVAYGDRK